MESIPSEEKVAVPTATISVRPKHTVEGHEQCAYYLDMGVEELRCPHKKEANGAFYNEDYLWDLRWSAHRLITILKAANIPDNIKRTIMREVETLEKLTK